MTNLFFYGSLRDPELLDIVLGTDQRGVQILPARLPDHNVFWVQGQGFPMIAQATGQVLEGVAALGLSDDHIARLNFYEGGFAYDLHDMQVQSGDAQLPVQIYWPEEGLYTAGDPWLLGEWQSSWGSLSREAAKEVMSLYGVISAEDLQMRFPRIRAMAATRLRAGAAPKPTHRAGFEASQITGDRERSHDGFYKLDTLHLRHPKFDGTQSDVLRREVFISSDATIVLPYDPVRDEVLLVEQFRMGPTGRGDAYPWCLEPVAGYVDPGETPEKTAYRETVEEAGLSLQKLEVVSHGYSSPGASSEFFYLFVGLCDLAQKRQETNGLDSEGEDIRSHVMGFETAMDLVESGEINVLPTILCLNWLARHRDRLRAGS